MGKWIAAATGLALALRLLHLGADSLWGDEAFTWHMTTLPWREVLLGQESVNFPAYYLLAKASTAVLGEGEAALRLPAALLMTAAIPFLALFARRIAGPRAAAMAAFVAALAPALLHYGQEARSYALLVFASAATLAAFARALESARAGDAIALGLAGALLLHAHPYGLLEIAGLGLFLVVERRRGTPLLGLAIAGALFAPYVPALLDRARHVAELPWLPPQAAEGAVRVPGSLLLWGGGHLFNGLFGALVVAACACLPRRWRRLAIVLSLTCWIGPVVHSHVGTSVFTGRYALGLAPLAIAAVGALVARAAERGRRPGLVAGAAVLGAMALFALHYERTRPHRPDWRTAFLELRRAAEEGATPVFVAQGTTRVAAYYFRGEAVKVGNAPKGTSYDVLEPLPPGRIAVVAKPGHRDAILAAARGRKVVRELPRRRREDPLFLVIE